MTTRNCYFYLALFTILLIQTCVSNRVKRYTNDVHSDDDDKHAPAPAYVTAPAPGDDDDKNKDDDDKHAPAPAAPAPNNYDDEPAPAPADCEDGDDKHDDDDKHSPAPAYAPSPKSKSDDNDKHTPGPASAPSPKSKSDDDDKHAPAPAAPAPNNYGAPAPASGQRTSNWRRRSTLGDSDRRQAPAPAYAPSPKSKGDDDDKHAPAPAAPAPNNYGAPAPAYAPSPKSKSDDDDKHAPGPASAPSPKSKGDDDDKHAPAPAAPAPAAPAPPQKCVPADCVQTRMKEGYDSLSNSDVDAYINEKLKKNQKRDGENSYLSSAKKSRVNRNGNVEYVISMTVDSDCASDQKCKNEMCSYAADYVSNVVAAVDPAECAPTPTPTIIITLRPDQPAPEGNSGFGNTSPVRKRSVMDGKKYDTKLKSCDVVPPSKRKRALEGTSILQAVISTVASPSNPDTNPVSNPVIHSISSTIISCGMLLFVFIIAGFVLM